MTIDQIEKGVEIALIASATLDPAKLRHLSAYRAFRQGGLLDALTDLRLVPCAALLDLLQTVTGIESVDPSIVATDAPFMQHCERLLPRDIWVAMGIMPTQFDGAALKVAMVNPFCQETRQALEALVAGPILPQITLRATLEAALGVDHRNGGRCADSEHAASVRALLQERHQQDLSKLVAEAAEVSNRRDDETNDGPVWRHPAVVLLLHRLLWCAVEQQASDVHFNQAESGAQVRFRVDGTMREFCAFSKSLGTVLCSRVKALGGLNQATGSTPSYAHVLLAMDESRRCNIRISILEALDGEMVALRLDGPSRTLDVDALGMGPHERLTLSESIAQPNGLILVTGPTGSGKTSTLYALLAELVQRDLALLTVEDPVERRIDGATQVPCDPANGITYATALRSLLRQDPDVIMVGEIRDEETAGLAVRAAGTGHLVIASLHTNDAVSALTRLSALGVAPYLVASSLRLVVAQRLLRRLCEHCRCPVRFPAERWVALGGTVAGTVDAVDIFEARGCARCAESGYRGRTGVFELLRVTRRMEDLVAAASPMSVLREEVRSQSVMSLRQSALSRVLDGETSIAEVLRTTRTD